MILSASALVASLCAGTLHGTVTDASGQGVAGATVSLTRSRLSTTTGSDGSWSMARVSGIHVRQGGTALPRNLRMQDGHLGVDYAGFDARGNRMNPLSSAAIPGSVAARASSASDTNRCDNCSIADTLVVSLGGCTSRSPVALSDTTEVPSVVLDTQTFEVRASSRIWNGMRVLSLQLTNQGAAPAESLSLRLFVNGLRDTLRDFGARLDIGMLYDAAGWQHPVVGPSIDSAVRRSHPLRTSDVASCGDTSWSWSVPLPGVVLPPSGRLVLDLVLDRHSVDFDSKGVATVHDELLNRMPSQDIFGRWSWSTGAHALPRYPGVPQTQGAVGLLDQNPSFAPVAPYIQVLRAGMAVQGLAPTCP